MNEFILIILVFITCGISEFIAYKIIKKIDQRERKKLQKWETNYIKDLEKKVEKLNDVNDSNNDFDSDQDLY